MFSFLNIHDKDVFDEYFGVKDLSIGAVNTINNPELSTSIAETTD